ncbi:uncharacterized protein LOC128557184 [Mercenaria mercenaria]|uniref:uncharacterized protein LOC128557184 n=1 Tax=Mercenaria mercenaria TaxID=6596 RepID=UPI00234EEAE2|nr:uncharacterized protein LOC128557184 [Mercenaria mercenaria]
MAEFEISRQSEEVVEMFCEHCSEHGNKNQPAEGFCVDCVKYFCATCLRYHRTFLPDHVTADKDSMPSDVYLEKCEQHPEELVKFYCLSCEETACSICKTGFHKQCEEVHHLPKLALDFEEGKEFSNFKNSLDLLEKEVADTELLLGNGRQKNEQYNADAISVLRKQKEEVEKIFDNFEQEIGKVHTANKNLLDKEEKSKDLLKEDINNLKTETEELKNSSRKCKLFLQTKRMKEERKQIKEKLSGTKTHLEQEVCKFRYQLATQKLKPERFGKVIAEPFKIVKVIKWNQWNDILFLTLSFIFCVMLTGSTHITVEKLSNIEVSFDIKQIFYLSEHCLLISEPNREIVHVYNPKNSNWISQIHQSQLKEITRVRDDMVAVTFTGNVEIRSVSCSQSDFSWEVVKYIDVGKNCKFIQYRLGKLFVICSTFGGSSRIIKIFDDKGNKLDSFIIHFVAGGITISPNGKNIYISYNEDSLIISYTTEGKVVNWFRNDTLSNPSAMTVDSNGNLFVCGYFSHNIFYISADLKYGYEILNESHGIYLPNSITYDGRESILYLRSQLSNSIQVFKINSKRFPYFLYTLTLQISNSGYLKDIFKSHSENKCTKYHLKSNFSYLKIKPSFCWN